MLHTINVEYWCLKRELWRKIFSLLWCWIKEWWHLSSFQCTLWVLGSWEVMSNGLAECHVGSDCQLAAVLSPHPLSPKGKTPIWLYGKYFLFCQVRHAQYPCGCLANQWGLKTERPCGGGSHSDLTKELPSNSSVDMSLTSQSLNMLSVCPSSHSRSSLAVACASLSESFLLGGACDKLYDLFFIYVIIFWLLW